ncbi:MAG TPA: helix-turn-helix domain-containing protein, partial [Chloroflexota bacterium]
METGARPHEHASFGDLLKRYRTAAGLTQEELAERAELSVRGLRYLEQGLRRPYRDTLERLVQALALPPPDLRTLTAAARPRSIAPSSDSRHGTRSNIPMPPSPLIGRKRDVRTAVELLYRDDVRVLTLTGPGGVGKTRLAIDVAAHLQPAFTDGTIWIPLAALTDSTLVPSAIAQALGLMEFGSVPLQALIQSSLRDRQMLMLLDNFEHVMTAAALVADLVAMCPQLKVLVTSRAALRLRSEREFSVL